MPDDIANEITDIPHDLELNQEDFSDVLPRLPDDLQDFDFFEGMAQFFDSRSLNEFLKREIAFVKYSSSHTVSSTVIRKCNPAKSILPCFQKVRSAVCPTSQINRLSRLIIQLLGC